MHWDVVVCSMRHDELSAGLLLRREREHLVRPAPECRDGRAPTARRSHGEHNRSRRRRRAAGSTRASVVGVELHMHPDVGVCSIGYDELIAVLLLRQHAGTPCSQRRACGMDEDRRCRERARGFRLPTATRKSTAIGPRVLAKTVESTGERNGLATFVESTASRPMRARRRGAPWLPQPLAERHSSGRAQRPSSTVTTYKRGLRARRGRPPFRERAGARPSIAGRPAGGEQQGRRDVSRESSRHTKAALGSGGPLAVARTRRGRKAGLPPR